ncbi:MAG: sulfatase [Planctomycetota bacterium]
MPSILLHALALLSGLAQSTPAPNLLVVVTDDQRWDHMSCAGHPVLKTPEMDELAERGVRFTNAFVTTPICAASRASIMTSRWERGHGYTFGTPPLGTDLVAESYFARLRAAGYETSFVGKFGVRMAKEDREPLFDHFTAMSAPYIRKGQPHLTVQAADKAISYLPEGPSETPFCMTVSFNAPHAHDSHKDQFIPPPDLASLYQEASVPALEGAVEDFEALPEFLQQSLGRRRWGWRFDTETKRVRRTKDYWRMISGVDRAVGRIMDALEERGLADNTVVVFTSDNGFFLGERGLAGKWLIYEESIRVPLIVMDPRVEGEAGEGGARRLCEAYALNVDLAPTLLDLAGVPIPDGYEGRSLVPLLRGEAPEWRKQFIVEHRFDHAEIPKSVGLRTEHWAYARYDEQLPPFEQLFDLKADPRQRRNLAGAAEHRDLLRSFRKTVAGDHR